MIKMENYPTNMLTVDIEASLIYFIIGFSVLNIYSYISKFLLRGIVTRGSQKNQNRETEPSF